MKNSIWIVLVLFVALGAVHCGDDGDGDNGNDTSNLSAKELAAGGCEEQNTFNEDDCDGLDDYADCVESDCGHYYDECLGSGYEDGNFAGSPCEEFMDCVAESDDTCNNDCELGTECGTCFLAMGQCAKDNCFNLLDCYNDDGNGGCADLDACCASLEEESRVVCEMQAQAVKPGGDYVCQITYNIFCG